MASLFKLQGQAEENQGSPRLSLLWWYSWYLSVGVSKILLIICNNPCPHPRSRGSFEIWLQSCPVIRLRTTGQFPSQAFLFTDGNHSRTLWPNSVEGASLTQSLKPTQQPDWLLLVPGWEWKQRKVGVMRRMLNRLIHLPASAHGPSTSGPPSSLDLSLWLWSLTVPPRLSPMPLGYPFQRSILSASLADSVQNLTCFTWKRKFWSRQQTLERRVVILIVTAIIPTS